LANERRQPFHGGDRLSACAGRNIRPDELIDFSVNIMPFGLSEAVRGALQAGLNRCCQYPDPSQRELRQALARWHQLSPEQIVCGNGAVDVLYRTLHVLKPRRVFLPVPTFLEYEKACLEQQAQIVRYYLPEEEDFRVTDALIDFLKTQKKAAGRDLLILCNPSNPTGLLIEPPLLDRILSCCKDLNIWLLLDECFMDFTDQPWLYSRLQRLQHDSTQSLLMLNSMTKFYAMPGLRLGYLCAHSTLAAAVQASGQPWPVGTLAEIAGLAALREREEEPEGAAVERQRWLQKERDCLSQALRARGWRVWPAQANYLLFRAEGVFDLDERLLKHRILIRSCANYPGLGEEYYRIAVKSAPENQYLMEVLNDPSF
jgi:threonine-phosphate decarboxylase